MVLKAEGKGLHSDTTGSRTKGERTSGVRADSALVGISATLALSLPVLAVAIGIDTFIAAVVALAVMILLVWSIRRLRAQAPLVLAVVGLLTFGYGFNNISIVGIPAVLILLVLGTALTWRDWWPSLQSQPLYGYTYLLLLLLVVFRLTLDVPGYGATAIRDALYVVDVLAFLCGISWFRTLGIRVQDFDMIAYIVLGWHLTFAFRQLLIPLSPTVGIQYGTPLFDYTLTGPIAVVLFFYFSFRSGPWAILASLASVLSLMISQQKGPYISFFCLLLSVVAVALVQRNWTFAKRVLATLVTGAILGSIVLAVVPVSGRLQQAGAEGVLNQFRLLAGDDDEVGSESVEYRRQWQPLVFDAVDRAPAGQIIGAGFGTDLIGGFETQNGALVRKPHNDYLEAYGRTGVLGLVLYVAILCVPLYWCLRVFLRHQSAVGVGLFSLEIVTLLVAATQPWFAFSYGGLPYFAAGGIAYAWHIQDRGPSHEQ